MPSDIILMDAHRQLTLGVVVMNGYFVSFFQRYRALNSPWLVSCRVGGWRVSYTHSSSPLARSSPVPLVNL